MPSAPTRQRQVGWTLEARGSDRPPQPGRRSEQPTKGRSAERPATPPSPYEHRCAGTGARDGRRSAIGRALALASSSVPRYDATLRAGSARAVSTDSGVRRGGTDGHRWTDPLHPHPAWPRAPVRGRRWPTRDTTPPRVPVAEQNNVPRRSTCRPVTIPLRCRQGHAVACRPTETRFKLAAPTKTPGCTAVRSPERGRWPLRFPANGRSCPTDSQRTQPGDGRSPAASPHTNAKRFAVR